MQYTQNSNKMITLVVLSHTLLSCVNQALSDDQKTLSVDELETIFTTFCHTVLHYGDPTDSRLRTFDMKEFIKGNPRFPPQINFVQHDWIQFWETICNQPGGYKPTEMEFECLDVLKDNNKKDDLRNRFPQLQPYFDYRPRLSKALGALATFAKDTTFGSLTNFSNSNDRVHGYLPPVKDHFLSIPNLSAAANFDLALLNLLMLTMIGDVYRAAILGLKVSGWAEIEFAYQTHKKYLLENWTTKQLANDIQAKVEQSTAPGNTDPLFPWPGSSIQTFLENKYYWNAFRVHVYPREKVRDVERFLCTNADTYPKTACVRGGGNIAIVHWQPLADDKLMDANKIIDRRRPPPELKQLLQEQDQDNVKPSTSNTFAAVSACLEMTSVLEPAAEAALDRYFPQETVMKGSTLVQESAKQARGAAKVFKGVLKFAVNVGKFLGPLAMGITSLLGVLMDEEAPNVVEEMRSGFKNMSNEFRKLDVKLGKVKNEIIDAVKTEIWMATFHLSYFERVRLPLSKLRLAFGQYDTAIRGPSEEYKRQELQAFCDPSIYIDGIASPVGLLTDMHTYFVPGSAGVQNFPDVITNWPQAKSHRGTLLLLLAGFLMDVTDLEVMVQRCMPILVNAAPNKQRKLKVTAGYSDKAALAQRQAYEIKKVIFKMNHAQLYGWIESIPGTFDAWIPSADSDLNSMADTLTKHLQKAYDWNAFNVLVFKHKVEKEFESSGSEAHVLHPDYTKILTRHNYTYVINWADRDEPITKIKNSDDFDYYWCEQMNSASMLMDRASNVGVPNGTKSVYIRKDILEDGYYTKGDKLGSPVVDALSKTNLEFKKPQGCCGTAGELAVSYGPNRCWIDKKTEQGYCKTTKEEWVNLPVSQTKFGKTRELCDVCDVRDNARHWTVHNYTVVMNSGGGY